MNKLQGDLNEYFQENSITRMLFPFGMWILLVSAGILLLAEIPVIGGIVNFLYFQQLWFVVFYIGALLVFAKADYKLLSLGFLLRFISIILIFFGGRHLFIDFVYYIIAAIFTGYISYTCYKKTV